MLARYMLSPCVRLSVHLSVRPSVTSRSSTKTAKPQNTYVCKNCLEPPFGGLRGNVHGSSMARWKAPALTVEAL